MTLAVLLMVVLILFLLAGAFPVYDGMQVVVFHTPVFILLLGCLVVSLVVCSFRRLSLRQVGFPLTHLGVALILAGALVGFLAGKQGEVSVPVGAEYSLSEMPTREGIPESLGFDFSITSFKVERYDPDYALFRPAQPAAIGEMLGAPAQSDGDAPRDEGHTFVRKVRIGKDGLARLDNGKRLDANALRDDKGGWAQQLALSNGWVLQSLGQVDRRYLAVLRITDGGVVRETDLTVNHPVEHGGWRFCLMSYDREREKSVTLTVRRDPGRKAVIAGIWALMIGTASLCFRKHGGSHARA